MHNFIESIENDEIKYLEFKLCFWGMGKVLEAKEELGKPILWGMGWVNRRLGSFGGHPVTYITEVFTKQTAS
jgi:hypothetical protein